MCAALVEVILQRGQVADRRVEPDVEVLARRVGDLDPEVRRVAADVPVAEAAVSVFVGLEPFADLVKHLGLQVALLRPTGQEGDAARVAQLEEVVLALLHHRRGAGERGVGVLQVGRRVDRAAHVAVVAVLVLRAALRAFALDVAVGQEHRFQRIEELLDRLRGDQLVLAQGAIDVLAQCMVLRPVGRAPVVEADVKAVEVLLAPGGNGGDKGLRRRAGLLGGNHDRRPVRIVGADEVHLVAPHALEADPDVGLDVLHHMADVERPVRIGQGGGDEELAGGLGGRHGQGGRQAPALQGNPEF